MLRSIHILTLVLAFTSLSSLEVARAETDLNPSQYIGQWSFDHNARDASPAENDGEVSKTRFSAGISGQSLRLYGTGEMTVFYNSSMDTQNGVMVSVWLKTAQPNQTATIVGRGILGSEAGGWVLGLDGGQPVFQTLNQAGEVDSILISDLSISTNVWFNLTAWIDLEGLNVGMTVDGAASSWRTLPDSANLMPSDTDLIVGDNFVGWIDELTITKPWDQ